MLLLLPLSSPLAFEVEFEEGWKCEVRSYTISLMVTKNLRWLLLARSFPDLDFLLFSVLGKYFQMLPKQR